MSPKKSLLSVLALGVVITGSGFYLFGTGGPSIGHAQSKPASAAPASAEGMKAPPNPTPAPGRDAPPRLNMRPDSPTATPAALPGAVPATASATTAATTSSTALPTATTSPAQAPAGAAPGTGANATGRISAPTDAPPAPQLSTPRPLAPPAAATNGAAQPAQAAAQPVAQPANAPGVAAPTIPAQPTTQLGAGGSMTIVPTPEVATLSALTQMQGEVLLAKAKVDLKTMEVQLKKLERELNPPNPLEELAAAGITLPPNLIAGARPTQATSNPSPAPANLSSPVVQALQAILPVPDKTDQPPKLLLIRGKDVILEAVFEISEDGPAPAPGAQSRDRITPPGRQITVTVGEELPGKWVVHTISHSTVVIAQRGKVEQLILRPGDYLPIRYTEPASTRSAKPKSAPTSLRPAGAKPAAATPAAARPTAPAKTSAPSRGSTSKGATDAKRAPAKPAKPSTYDDDNSG